jgi:hypothetical protein
MTIGIQHRARSRGRHLPLPRRAGSEGGRGDPRAQPGLLSQAGANPRAREGLTTTAGTITGPAVCIVARISAWIRRCERDLSARTYAADDARARRYGWTVTQTTGRFGFEARSYRDPRFDNRREQLAPGIRALGLGRDAAAARQAGE